MRSTWHIFLLLSAFIAHASLVSCHQEISPLRQWLQDADARKALTDVLGGEKPLLPTAYNAALQNITTLKTPQVCLADIATTLQSMTIWAAKFADSSVKLPEGILAGAFTHLGNWDECVSVRNKESSDPTRKLHGQMCVIGITALPNSQDDTFGREISLELPMRLQHRAASDLSMLGGIYLQMGVCVPSTCTAADIQELFNLIIQPLPSVGNMKLTVLVNDAACTTQDRPSFDTADWVAVGILIFLGVLLVASTTYDVVLPTERKRTLFTAFSIVSNGKKMLAAPRPGSDTTLSCLHGMRFLSMCWVLLGHRYSLQLAYPVINFLYALDFVNSVWRVGLTNAAFAVDTFFVLSGLLVAYLFFKLPPSSRQLNIPLYYLHRYIRLTAPLAMMVLLSSSILYHVGWGPLWRLQLDGEREACHKSWWNVLLYVNNYVNPNVSCVGQSWYLMVDMQLHWLSPIILILLHKAPRIGRVTLGVLLLSGIVINFVISYVLNIPASTLAPVDLETQIKFYDDFYIPAYTRFVPYLVGFTLGYFLAMKKVNNTKFKKFSLIVSFTLWLIVAALLLLPLFLGYYFFQTPLPSRVETAFFNCLNRPIWALGIVGVIYLCVSGHGKPVNVFLSWPGFQILGRFTYGIYLVHIAVIGLQAASTRTYSYFSDGVILPAFAGDLLLSLLVAALLTLVCESPFLIIEKELLGTRHRREKAQNPALQNVSSTETVVEKKPDI